MNLTIISKKESKMKKRNLFWIIPTGLLVTLLLISLFGHLFSPAKAKPLVQKQKDTSDLITPEQMKKDLSYLKYYFENVYIGYDFLIEKGFDIDKICDDIYKKTMKDAGNAKKISKSTFMSNIKQLVMKDFDFMDMHFSLGGQQCKNQQTLYFSDIYIREKDTASGKKYYVYKNESEPYPEDIKKNMNFLPPAEVKPGQEYTGPVENLYPCFDGKELVYRFCVFTSQNIQKVYISVDGQKVWAPVLPSLNITNGQQYQGFKETKDTAYFSMSAFNFDEGSDLEVRGKQEFNKMCENAKNHVRGKKNIIIDLRNNGGGNPLYRNVFFANMMYYNTELTTDIMDIVGTIGEEDEKRLISPPICQVYRRSYKYQIKNYFKKLKFKKEKVTYAYEIFEKQQDKRWNKVNIWHSLACGFIPYRKLIDDKTFVSDGKILPPADFKGDIYILTNRNSASCSEYSMALAYAFNKMDGITVHQIGENTCGAVSYVNPLRLILPYSGFLLKIPTAYNNSQDFNHPAYHGEGFGWYPEYWTSSFNISNTLQNLIDDPDLAEMLKGIERHHL